MHGPVSLAARGVVEVILDYNVCYITDGVATTILLHHNSNVVIRLAFSGI